jgi:RNase P protein component
VGNAVQRHQRQRQLRHLLADLWDELPTGSLVVRALPGEHAGLQADLRRAVRRL